MWYDVYGKKFKHIFTAWRDVAIKELVDESFTVLSYEEYAKGRPGYKEIKGHPDCLFIDKNFKDDKPNNELKVLKRIRGEI